MEQKGTEETASPTEKGVNLIMLDHYLARQNAATVRVCAPSRYAVGNVDGQMIVQETLLRAISNIESFQPGQHVGWLLPSCNLFRIEYPQAAARG